MPDIRGPLTDRNHREKFTMEATNGVRRETLYEVRDMLIRFQNLNQTSFQPFLTSVNSATIQEHISSMLLPNKWGTHIEILAAATIYQVPVYCCVHSPVPSDYVAPQWVCVKPVRPKEKSFLAIQTLLAAEERSFSKSLRAVLHKEHSLR